MSENKELEQTTEIINSGNENTENNPIKENDNINGNKNRKTINIMKYIAVGGAGLVIGAFIFTPTTETIEKANKYDSIVLKLTTATETLTSANASIESLEKEKNDLQEKVNEAAPWFELSKKQRDEQMLTQEKKDNAKYLNLVDSGKSYYNMSTEERTTIDEWIDSKYDDSISQLQKLYKEKYNTAEKDRESSLAKIDKEAKKAKEAKKKADEKARKKAEAEKYNTGLTWEQIAREGNVGTLCQFKGRVLQVMKGDGYVQYRVATKGDYDNVMLIEIHNPEKTILEDDYIAFKGSSMGTIEYTTVLGSEVSIPAVLVVEYTIK